MLSNSPRAPMPIRLERAKSFSLGVFFTLANETPADISGCQISLTVRDLPYKGGLVQLTEAATIVSGSGGEARLDLQASDLDLPVGLYTYTIALLTAEDYSVTVVKGDFEIVENADEAWIGVTYASVLSPTTLTAMLQRDNSFVIRLDHVPHTEEYVTLDPSGVVPQARLPIHLTSAALDEAYVNGGAGNTAARPAHAAIGVGGMWFDTALGKPIWSTGAAWVDATGVAV